MLPAGPDRRRHDGQRRVLLRAGPGAGRARAAAVVADVVQRRRGELPRRGPAGHRGQGLLAGPRPGARHRARRAPAAADGARRPRLVGRARPRRATGCSGSSSSAASSGRTAPPGSPTGSRPGSREQRRRPARRAAQHAERVPRAHAHQRARAHLGPRPRVRAAAASRPGTRRCGRRASPVRVSAKQPSSGAVVHPERRGGGRQPLQVQVVRLGVPGRTSHAVHHVRRAVLEQRGDHVGAQRRVDGGQRPGRGPRTECRARRAPRRAPTRRRPGGSRAARNRPTSSRSSSAPVGAGGAGRGHRRQHARGAPRPRRSAVHRSAAPAGLR